MGEDGMPDIRAKSGNVQRGAKSDPDLRGNHDVSKTPDLRRKSNYLERIQEAGRDPIPRTKKKFSLHVLEKVTHLLVEHQDTHEF